MIDNNDQLQTDDVDELFLERLQAFLDKSLVDLRAFSLRENRPFDQTRRHVADWHARYLFHPQITVTAADRRDYIYSALADTSRVLESLHTHTGIHSFFLAIDPANPTDQGFLGGTVLGREFWRGLRGGGDVGASSFRSFCLKSIAPSGPGSGEGSNVILKSPITTKRGPASSVKAQVYANVRDALRAASQSRTAEMKWTNHARLQSAYAVCLVGWPPDIPMRNPSALTMVQNQTVLEALREGRMRFERVGERDEVGVEDKFASRIESGERGGDERRVGADVPVNLTGPEADVDDDISWAYEYRGPSTSTPASTSTDPPLTEAVPSMSTHDEAGPSSHPTQFRAKQHPTSQPQT